MSSTPVARLVTSTKSPPTCLAMSARSGMVATTRSLSAAPVTAGKRQARVDRTMRTRFMVWLLLSIAEAVDVAAHDHRPLQEELVVVAPGLAEMRVLQPEALELRRPDRQIGRVTFGGTLDPVDVLRVLEHEPGGEAPRKPRFEIGVHAE